MIEPTPLFTTTFTIPLTAGRLSPEEVAACGRAVSPERAAPEDPRLEDSAGMIAFRAITCPGEARLLVEWPDGVLAWAFIALGLPARNALEKGLAEAYERGRAQLQAVHLRLGQTAGCA